MDETSSNYWRKRVAELDDIATREFDHWKDLEDSYFACIAKRQDVSKHRDRLDAVKRKASDALATLKASREILAETEAAELNDNLTIRAMTINAGQDKLRAGQQNALTKLAPFVTALRKGEDGAKQIREHGDTPLRGLLADRFHAVAALLVAKLADEFPELIEPLARAAANSKENSKRVAGKSLDDLSQNYTRDFLTRHPVE